MVISGVNGRASKVFMKSRPSQEELGLPPRKKPPVEKARCNNCDKIVDKVSFKNHQIVCLRNIKNQIQQRNQTIEVRDSYREFELLSKPSSQQGVLPTQNAP